MISMLEILQMIRILIMSKPISNLSCLSIQNTEEMRNLYVAKL